MPRFTEHRDADGRRYFEDEDGRAPQGVPVAGGDSRSRPMIQKLVDRLNGGGGE